MAYINGSARPGTIFLSVGFRISLIPVHFADTEGNRLAMAFQNGVRCGR